jgi:hypothetical protein
MTDREKLIEILRTSCAVGKNCHKSCIECTADHLLANGVTFTPAVPGPSESDPNIMELCFHNGERHMKEKMITMLQDVLDQADGFCMIDVAGVIKAVEDL